MTRFDNTQEREQFRRLADGSLTGEEFAAIEQRLLSDASFRQRYIFAMNVEAGLYEAFNFPGTFSVEATRKKTPVGLFAMTASCLIGLAGFSGWILFALTRAAPNPEPLISQTTDLKPVAIITRVEPIAGGKVTSLRPGTRLKPGSLIVADGQAQLEFLNGVQINLEGPAELRIRSDSMATLVSGKAAVRVPPGARGFVLSTPNAAIVDLGTEFAVSIGARGESEVHVVEGDVDVSLLGNDGNTLTSERISEAKTVRIRRESAELERVDQPGMKIPVIHSQQSAPLSVTADYVSSVRASRPVIYWRFETRIDGKVPNEIGSRWAGRIYSTADEPSAITIRDGVARFASTVNGCRIEPEESVPGLNRESFSIESWVSPDCFHSATLVAVVPEKSAGPHLQLSLIELAYQTSLVYPPGSFRFLHRSPAGSSGGFNLFSDSDCTPGFWHHIVAVKTPAGMKFFVNGKLVRNVSEPTGSDNSAYHFFVGSLNESGARQFSGAVDEFALYLRALREDEIQAHYSAIAKQESATILSESIRD